jgi:thymidylate kinase
MFSCATTEGPTRDTYFYTTHLKPSLGGNMLLIIDGPRGAGKDTLIREIIQRIPDMEVHVFHNDRPWNRSRQTMLQTYEAQYRFSQRPGTLVIVNRAHYSERAYGLIHRGLATDMVDEFDAEAWRLHHDRACAVHVTANIDALRQRRNERRRPGEPPVEDTDIALEVRAFRNAAHETAFRSVFLDTASVSAIHCAEIVIDHVAMLVDV